MERYVIINNLDVLTTFIYYLKDNGFHGRLIPEENTDVDVDLKNKGLLEYCDGPVLISINNDKQYVDLANSKKSIDKGGPKEWDTYIWMKKKESWVDESMTEYLEDNIRLLDDYYPDWEWKFDDDSDSDDILILGKTYKTSLCMDPDWPDQYCRRVEINGKLYYFE